MWGFNDMIKVAISSCLLGEKVRYDGRHKRSHLCQSELSQYFEYVPLCPEVGIGMGIPRDPIRLVGDPRAPRAVGVKNADYDVTEDLENYAREQLSGLAEICGYIFMQDSPSCGLFQVKVYQADGSLQKPARQAGHNRGIFAAAITRAQPLLPVEEAGRLQDPVVRQNFLARVFAYAESARGQDQTQG